MQFIARQGELYAHLFENSRTGLARDLYWNINVDLEPVELLEETWDSSFQCEWLVWPTKEIGDLDGKGLAQLRRPELVEASLYLVAQHHPIAVSQLAIRRAPENDYCLDASGAVDIEIDGERLRGPFRFECRLNFVGIVVVPESLTPKPSSPKEVAAALAPFISLVGLEEPRFERFRYVLRPKTT